jgi:hypothetical protein
MRIRIGVLLVFVTAAFSIGMAAQDDSMDGTWKMNPTESTYSPGPAPKAVVMTIEPAGENALKITTQTTEPDGSKDVSVYVTNLDDKDSAVSGDKNADTASMKRVDTNTTEQTNKKNGKATTKKKDVVSKDKKKMTVTTTGKDANGQNSNNVEVYDKQQ